MFAYIGNRFHLVASKLILNDNVAVPMNVVVDNRHAHGHGHGHAHGHGIRWMSMAAVRYYCVTGTTESRQMLALCRPVACTASESVPLTLLYNYP